MTQIPGQKTPADPRTGIRNLALDALHHGAVGARNGWTEADLRHAVKHTATSHDMEPLWAAIEEGLMAIAKVRYIEVCRELNMPEVFPPDEDEDENMRTHPGGES